MTGDSDMDSPPSGPSRNNSHGDAHQDVPDNSAVPKPKRLACMICRFARGPQPFLFSAPQLTVNPPLSQEAQVEMRRRPAELQHMLPTRTLLRI